MEVNLNVPKSDNNKLSSITSSHNLFSFSFCVSVLLNLFLKIASATISLFYYLFNGYKLLRNVSYIYLKPLLFYIIYILILLGFFVLHPFLFPYSGRRTRALSYKYKTNQATLTYWMCFLSSNIMEDISPDPETRSTNT